MRTGRRWIVLDAFFFANGFTDRLLDRFGPAGICVFIALLCAAKRAPIQGQISYASDAEALDILGIRNLPLVDQAGDKWTLDDLWKMTGTQKQTRKTCRGRVKNVKITHWALWQETLTRELAAERMRRLRARNTRTGSEQFWEPEANSRVTDLDLDHDQDRDGGASQRRNGQVKSQAARKLKAAMRGDDG